MFESIHMLPLADFGQCRAQTGRLLNGERPAIEFGGNGIILQLSLNIAENGQRFEAVRIAGQHSAYPIPRRARMRK